MTETTEQQPQINERVLADISALEQQAQTEAKTESAENFETSPIGLWQAALIECVPIALSFAPDLAVTDEENEALAQGLAPALAKHFPINEAFAFPVEVVAIFTVFTVFNPKIQAIRAKRAAEQLKEVNPDAAPAS